MNTADILTLYQAAQHQPDQWPQVFKAMSGLRYGTTVSQEERATLSTAYEVTVYTHLWTQMNRDVLQLIAAGRAVADQVAQRLQAHQAVYEQGAPCWKCGGTTYVRHGAVSECRICRARQRKSE